MSFQRAVALSLWQGASLKGTCQSKRGLIAGAGIGATDTIYRRDSYIFQCLGIRHVIRQLRTLDPEMILSLEVPWKRQRLRRGRSSCKSKPRKQKPEADCLRAPIHNNLFMKDLLGPSVLFSLKISGRLGYFRDMVEQLQSQGVTDLGRRRASSDTGADAAWL